MTAFPKFAAATTLLLFGFTSMTSRAATLASWDFESGNLAATTQGNFVATSIDVINLGGTSSAGDTSFAAGAGVGGGGALAFEHPANDPDSVILFTIENTHPTDLITLDLASQSIGGEAGESYTIYYALNGGSPGDVDDFVVSQGAWTHHSFDADALLSGAGLGPGESFSFGWGLEDFFPSDLTTHYFDNVSITGAEPIPEPSASLLLLLGFGSILFRRRR